MCLHFEIILIFRLWECLRQVDVLLQEYLACSMIRLSENAMPIITMEWYSVQLQEARESGFSFLYNSDLWHQHDQCKCQSIADKEHLQVVIKYSYLLFGRKYSFEFFKIHIDLIQSTNKFIKQNYIHIIFILILYNDSKFRSKLIKCVLHEQNVSNKIFKPFLTIS